MKNILNYYYDLIPNNIHQVDRDYFFDSKGTSYAFVIYNRNVEEIEQIYKLTVELHNIGVLVHELILNKENKFITYYNQKAYVLLKVYQSGDKKIDIEEIEKFSNSMISKIDINKLRRDNWSYMWEEKIDYFEYQVNQFGKKYQNIRNSFSYFSGLVETGITLFNNLKLDYDKLSIQHRRLTNKSKTFDFYNPINLIIDYKVRDACEYFKYKFVKEQDLCQEIICYLTTNNLTQYELVMFYTRLFYPSFYFDLYEEIMEEEKDDYAINEAISLVNKYEQLLLNVYIFLSNYITLPDIEWIKKT